MHSFNRYITPDHFTSALGINGSLGFSGYNGDVFGDPVFERWLVMSLIESPDAMDDIQVGNDVMFEYSPSGNADFESQDSFISILAQKVHDGVPVITLFEEQHSSLIDNTVISVEVPLVLAQSDSLLIVDSDHADSFVVTVSGMFDSVIGEQQIVKLPQRNGLRQRCERLGGGRMICLLNQKFNL